MNGYEEKEKNYLKKGGNICPSCESKDIAAVGEFEADGRQAWRRCVCNNCNAEWDDVYTLSGIDNLEEPENVAAEGE